MVFEFFQLYEKPLHIFLSLVALNLQQIEV